VSRELKSNGGRARYTGHVRAPWCLCARAATEDTEAGRRHSGGQRGSNENTNGLLRQYTLKGTDLSVYDADDLARVAASLNNRPRQTLGYLKPSEKFTALESVWS
jgi:hypothetical protein